jgi:phosphoenolpyruvate carboxylase
LRAAPLFVADRLSQRNLDVSLDRLANFLSVDRQQFDEACKALGEGECAADSFSDGLYVLHAVRMSLIAQGFALAASTPSFSPRHEISRETIADMALELRFAELASVIEEIFPESAAPPPEFSGLLEPADKSGEPSGYPEIKASIVEPLRALDTRIKEIAIGISHFYDAFG